MLKKLLASLVLVGTLSLGAQSPDVTGGHFGSKYTFHWDAVTTDINGNPEELSGYEMGAVLPPADLRIAGTEPLVLVFVPPTETSCSALAVITALRAAGVREGSTVNLWVRAIDVSNEVSAWSNMWSGKMDTVPPSAPSGFGCR